MGQSSLFVVEAAVLLVVLVAYATVGYVDSDDAITTQTTKEGTEQHNDVYYGEDKKDDAAAAAIISNTTSSRDPQIPKCNLYMAESTIPGAGIGIFTTQPIHKGQPIGNGDVYIPILDLEWHYEASVAAAAAQAEHATTKQVGEDGDELQPPQSQQQQHFGFVDPFGDYSWEGSVMGCSHEAYSYEYIHMFAPGIDAAVNSHSALNNVDKSTPMVRAEIEERNFVQLHRSIHAGVGTFTPYHNGTTHALHYIPPGGELFKAYGDEWFIQREYKLGQIPVVADYDDAGKLLDRILYMSDHSSIEIMSHVYNLVMTIRDIYPESRVLQALEPSIEDILLHPAKINNNNNEKSYLLPRHQQSQRITGKEILRSIHQPNTTRSISWLEKYGTCVDHIIPRPKSTLPNIDVGRGAFAKRFLPKGTKLTGSPLIHIPNRALLDMYGATDLTSTDTGNENKRRHRRQFAKTGQRQLLLNYCWGHEESTLLLCPYGSGVNYINHNQTLANVKIQWSKHGTLGQDDTWFKKAPHEMMVNNDADIDSGTATTPTKLIKPHLAFDYIVTRDIQEDEELFLDYGIEWEEAWRKHQQHWNAPPREDWISYVSATTLNRKFANDSQLYFRTVDEQAMDPYPSNVELRCHSRVVDNRPWRFQFDGSKKRIDWVDDKYPDTGYPCHVTRRYEKHGQSNITSANDTVTSPSPTTYHKKRRLPHKYWYDVIVFVFDELTGKTMDDAFAVERSRIPRKAIRFFDQPHTTDIYLPQAFRHDLRIPDDMVPEAWKNVPKRRSSSSSSSSPSVSTTVDEPSHKPRSTSAPDIGDTTIPLNTINRSEEITSNNVDTAHNITCELYLAESTIPNAGLGIFTTVQKQVGDSVTNGEPIVPVIDIDLHQGDFDTFHNPSYDYVWHGYALGMAHESFEGTIDGYWPGIGAAVNFYPPLVNVKTSLPSYDEAGFHRYTHPGAGAFTPYHLGIPKVTRSIPPGGELYSNYGDGWLLDREEFEGVPVVRSFVEAENLLTQFHGLFGNSTLNDRITRHIYEDVILQLRKIWGNSRVLNALPATLEESKIAFQTDIASLHQPDATRPLEWLRRNGKCMDHIVPGRSTIEDAGHGAFAKRFLPEGTIITGSPLHHLFRSFTDMYKVKENEQGERERIPSRRSGRQLLLNYCFGHPETTLLLCPYGAGVNYINHNRTLSNVRIQWSDHGTTSHNSSWFTLSPLEMYLNYQISLSFDYVATKDIPAGAELFLDYGSEWEQAWKYHVDNWKPREQWSSYTNAATYNKLMKNKPLPTEEEQQRRKKNSQQRSGGGDDDDEGVVLYPENLRLECHPALEGTSWRRSGRFDWVKVEEYGIPCNITRRHTSILSKEPYYTVKLFKENDNGKSNNDTEGYLNVSNVPRKAMKFFDLPYTTDIHLKGAFRHPIGIPDEMVPDSWKDRPRLQSKHQQVLLPPKMSIDGGHTSSGRSGGASSIEQSDDPVIQLNYDEL